MNKNHKRDIRIKAMYGKGLSYATIGNQFGVSRQRIHQIVKEYKPPQHASMRNIKNRDGIKNFHWLLRTLKRSYN